MKQNIQRLFGMILLVTSFHFCKGIYKAQSIVAIEYEGSIKAFKPLVHLPDNLRKLFPKVHTAVSVLTHYPELMSWYQILTTQPAATHRAINYQAETLLTTIANSDAAPSDKEIASNAVIKAAQAGRGELPYKVFHYHYEYDLKFGYTPSKKEIPHSSLIQVVDRPEQRGLSSYERLLTSWKRFTIVQGAVYTATLLLYLQHYIGDDSLDYFHTKQFITKFMTLNSTKRWLGASGFILGLGLYPFYRFSDLFKLEELTTNYPTVVVENKVVILYKRLFSHTKNKGSHIVHYYRLSEPLGYITLDEHKEQFLPKTPIDEHKEQFLPKMPIIKRQIISGAAIAMGMGGLIWSMGRGW